MEWRGVVLTCLAILSVSAPVLAQSNVVVSVAGEGFDGPPVFEVFVDGSSLGIAAITGAVETTRDGRIFAMPNPDELQEQHVFSLQGGAFSPDSKLEIILVNDRFEEKDDGYDRNIYIQSVEVDGLKIDAGQIGVTWNGVEIELPLVGGMRPVYASGQTAIVSPPEGGWPAKTATITAAPLPLPRPDGL